MTLDPSETPPAGDDLTLDEAAALAGVHYMTVYRWVRTSRLPAVKRDGRWSVTSADVLQAASRVSVDGRRAAVVAHGHDDEPVQRLVTQLTTGDLAGARTIVDEALVGGMSPEDLHLDLLGTAAHRVGEEWATGAISVAEEHRATATTLQLLGSLAHHFHRRGRRWGTIVLGAPSGDRHALPLALIVDPLRGRGFDVIDLGADVPAKQFAGTAAGVDDLRALGVHIAVRSDAVTSDLISALRAATTGPPIVLGGTGITDRDHALRLGADHFAASARAALDLLTSTSRT